MPVLPHDVRYGIRMLVKTPVVSAVAALSLALGIAGATAMFALASSFLLEPLPFGEQDGLVLIQQLRRGDSEEFASSLSMPNFRDLEAAASTMTGMTAFSIGAQNVTGVEQPRQVQIVTATPSFFEVMGVQPRAGRAFRAEEGLAGAGDVIVLTHGFWQDHFQGDPDVLGRTLRLDGRQRTVVGVMDEEFEMIPATVQGFVPSDFASAMDRTSRGFLVFGRLRSGATVEQARAELTGAFARLESEYPDANRSWTLFVQEARKWFPGPTDTKLVLLLLVVALFGLAIAGANVANLQLGRAELRAKEIAVRTVLGAGRMRVIRQLLTESIVLALAAGAVGTLMAVYVIRGLRTAMPALLPSSFWPSLDVPTLLATVVLAMGVGVAFGLTPAMHASAGGLRDALGEGSRGGTASRRRRRLRNAFVVSEVAVALALLTGAGFLMQAMDSLVKQDPGFETAGVLTFSLTLPEYRYEGPTELATFARDAERTLRALPGVEGVALMTSLPRGRGMPATAFHVAGTPALEETERPSTGWQAVNESYFETLGVSLASGRSFEATDGAGSRPVILVNRSFADRWLGDGEVIGRHVELLGESREIVGLVENITHNRISIDGRGDAAVYLPLAQRPLRSPSFALRVAGDPTALAAEVRQAIRSIDPDQPVADVQTLDAFIAEQLAAPRVLGAFVFALGLLATLLAAIGIYGVMAHNVAQSRREIGIRLAIGAQPGNVVRMITRGGAVLTVVGLAIGVPLAFAVYRAVISSLDLFEVEISSSYAFTAAAILTGVAMLASWLPARRAARVSPVSALQDE